MLKPKRIFLNDPNILRLCPYQQTSCLLPTDQDCLLRAKLNKLTEVAKWKQTIETCYDCEFRGLDLSVAQYNAKKLGTVV